MAGGRPSKFKPEFIKQAAKLVHLGATDENLAEFFEVHIDTIKEWKKVKPEFSAVLKTAKEQADDEVEKSLYQRAMGYSHPAVKIFLDKFGNVVEAPYTEHYPPDTTACIFWLKNRRKQQWRDVHRQEHTGPDGGPIETVQAVDAPPQETREQWLDRRAKEILESH